MTALFIDPGPLRSECALEACPPVADAIGGHTENWVEIATVFALIEPVSAASIFGAGQTLETVTHRITMRQRSGVASGMRFDRQGRIFNIVTVHDPDDTGRYLVCRVRETGHEVAMKLTLDGLVRGLRWKAHALAEDAEQRLPSRRCGDRDTPRRARGPYGG